MNTFTDRRTFLQWAGSISVLSSMPRIAAAQTSPQEIKVFCLPGMISVLQELKPKYESLSGRKLAISFEVNAPMKRRIDAGDKFDAVITIPDDFDELAKNGKIVSDFKVAIGRVGIGVWIRPGVPKPKIDTVDDFKQMLRQATSISYTKESGAGVYIAGLIDRLGMTGELASKTKFLGGGGQNPRAVAAGDIQYGISIITDGVGVPGVELLGPLPNEIQKWFVFVGGVSGAAADPTGAQDFIKFLASPENASVLKAKGWEPVA